MSTQSFLTFATAQMAELRALQGAMLKAKTPAEAARVKQEMFDIIGSLNEDGHYWVDKDLRPEMRSAFRSAGGTGGLGSKYTGRASREVTRAHKSVDLTTQGLRKWADNYEKAVIADRQYAAVTAQSRKIFQRLELGDFRGNAERIQLEEELAKYKKIEKDLKRSLDRQSFAVAEEPSVYYRKKGTARSRQVIRTYPRPAEQHVKLIAETYSQRMRSLGTLAAAEKGSGYVIVSDGPDCGWKSHRDPDKANGKIVSVEEAFKYPSAHPGCQRVFIPTEGGPKSKKTKEQLQRLIGAPQQASKSEVKRKLEKVAKVGAIAGVTASAVSEAGKNPLVRRAVREILNDAEVKLSPLMERALTAWVGNYAKREAGAMALSGTNETVDQFRARIASGLDRTYGNIEFLDAPRSQRFNVAEETARALGISKSTTKGQILDAIDDYGTWITHMRAQSQNLYENLLDAQIYSAAAERLTGQAAIDFAITKRPGQQVVKNWSRSVFHLKKVIDGDPERMAVDAIRGAAAILDPFPWLSTRHGKFRFSVGMSSQGRQDLAEFLYERMRGQTAYHPVELEWARNLGVDLTQRNISVKDVRDALIPRVTLLGKPFSATIAIERGRLVPVARFMPEQAGLQWLSVNARIRSSDELLDAIRNVVNFAGTAEDRRTELRLLLQQLNQNSIFTIDAFRNGPLRASLRFIGNEFQSFAVKLRPEQEWLRMNYRIYRHDLRVKLREPKVNPFTGRTVQYETVNRIDQTYTIGVLPLRGSAVNLVGPTVNEYGEIDVTGLVAKLFMWRGNLAEIAVATGVSYESLLRRLVDDAAQFAKGFARAVGAEQARIETFVALAKEYNLSSVRSLRDLEDKLKEIKLAASGSRVGETAVSTAGQGFNIKLLDARYVDQDIIKLDNQVLNQDISNFLTLWERTYGAGAIPKIRIAADGEAVNGLMAFDHRTREIVIRQEIVRNWSEHGRARAAMVRMGRLAPGTESGVASIFHEAAHSLVDSLTKAEYRDLWKSVFESYRTWDEKLPLNLAESTASPGNVANFRRLLNNWFSSPAAMANVMNRVSHQAVRGPDELIAEALSEFYTAPANMVRPIARAVGEWFESRAAKRPFMRMV